MELKPFAGLEFDSTLWLPRGELDSVVLEKYMLSEHTPNKGLVGRFWLHYTVPRKLRRITILQNWFNSMQLLLLIA